MRFLPATLALLLLLVALLPVTPALALPTFTVGYDGNGSTGGSPPVDVGSYSSGAKVTVLGNSGSLARTDYTFAGWNTATDGSGMSYLPGVTLTITGNTTLYAIWTVPPPFIPPSPVSWWKGEANGIDSAGINHNHGAMLNSTSKVTESSSTPASVSCGSGTTITAYTATYGANCNPTNCGSCPLGATNCSFTFNNSSCGDPCPNIVKSGILDVMCGPGSTGFAAGRIEQAFSFAGTTAQHVAIPHSPSLNLAKGHTVAFWVNLTAYPAAGKNFYLVNKWQVGAEDKRVTVDANGHVGYFLYGGFSTILTSTAVLPLSAWTHVAVTYDGGTAKVYINGVPDTATVSGSGDVADGVGKLYLAYNPERAAEGNEVYFNGLLDEVGWYNRALSSGDVKSLYFSSTFSGSLPDGIYNTPYTQTISAAGGPYQFTIDAGALPPGLNLDTAGALRGTPTATGTYSFTVKGSVATPDPFAIFKNYVLVIAPASQAVASVSAGSSTTCGVKSDGSLVCWGDPQNIGMHLLPSGTFAQVSVGNNIACGLSSDGDIICWGYGWSGTGYTQVSAGDSYTCALAADKTISCLLFTEDAFGLSIPPRGAFTQISTGLDHACGVHTDGSVACWGNTMLGMSSPPSGTFTQVSAGANHTCGVKSDQSVVCWGYNGSGQASPSPGAFTQVSAGYQHTCGLKTDGTVNCWGGNGLGQAAPPPGIFTQVSAGFDYTCGVRPDGSVACWGDNSSGQAPKITIAPPSLPDGVVGTHYSQTITGSGGTAPYTCNIVSGTLPPGLDLTSTGVLSGTPTLEGVYHFIVEAVGSGAIPFSGTQSYVVTVDVATQAVTVSTSPSGRSITVDGTTYTAPQNFAWTNGSSHTIAATSPQTGSADVQYLFNSWSDGGAPSHSVTPVAPTTYTANFDTYYTLSTSITGSGSVNSGDGIACSSGTPPGTCAFFYLSGTKVTLRETVSASTFSSWGDACAGCGSTAACQVTVDGVKNCSATFETPALVTVSGLTDVFSLLQPAYTAAGNGAIIKVQALTFIERLLLNSAGKMVTIKGGYNPTFTTQGGVTTVQGSLTIGKGGLVADRLAVR